jgi:hypothetical protein
MTSSRATSAASDDSVVEYEDLRGRVLGGSAAGRYFDLQLLIREGIAAWMARCSGRTVPHVLPKDPALRVAAAPMMLDEIHACPVRGLASIALASRREMST